MFKTKHCTSLRTPYLTDAPTDLAVFVQGLVLRHLASERKGRQRSLVYEDSRRSYGREKGSADICEPVSTITFAQAPFACAQLKQISAPPWSLDLPFEVPFPAPCPWFGAELLNLASSSLSSFILFFRATLLSRLDCLFLSFPSSVGTSKASMPPGK